MAEVTEGSSFRLDLVNLCLWRKDAAGADERLKLAPKTFDVLRYLVENTGRLVTHDELLTALWRDVHVQPEVLKSHILAIRNVLGDKSANPRFIETRRGRGYRFIGEMNGAASQAPPPDAIVELGVFAGRAEPLQQLQALLRRAASGEPQALFISGEPGIGKTTLVQQFLTQARRRPDLAVAQGQCIEGFAGVEPYYPVLEALGDLCRGAGSTGVIRTVLELAPSWAAQMPAPIFSEHRTPARQQSVPDPRSRMVREACCLFEALATERPLVLILEDLHWADYATIDLLSALCRRRSSTNRLVIATYRPEDLATARHPLQQMIHDLALHKYCCEIELAPLSTAAIGEVLTGRGESAPASPAFAHLVEERTGGNPLCMQVTLEYLLESGEVSRTAQGWQPLVPLDQLASEVPPTLARVIEARIERMSDEQRRVLETASVAGARFDPVTAARAAQMDELSFEAVCENLTASTLRRDRLLTLPSNQVVRTYSFRHALYRQVLYDRIGQVRRAFLHRAIGERLEEIYPPDQRGDLAIRLAQHFASAGDWARALDYLRSALRVATDRFSRADTLAILDRASEQAARLPDSARIPAEIEFLERRVAIQVAAPDPKAGETYAELADKAGRHGDANAPGYFATVADRGYLVSPISRAARERETTGDMVDASPLLETNLRRYLTGVIGRQAELAELQTCLNDRRMVTLIGPGGVGKTRLAVELGRRVLPDFPGGVWLIDLAPLSDPAQLLTAVATVLRLDASTAEAAVGAIAATLLRRRSLMIFDNCEHLAGAASDLIEALLTGVPGLSVVATSQQALHLDAEQLYLVRPLPVPPEDAVAIEGFGAVDLFVERANRADRLFRLGPANEAGVAEICRRLDGLPLALEMAAARLRLLGVEGLQEGLDHRLKLLKGAQHADNMRHRSLRAMVEWSHGLLDPQERHLFRCLAAFPGSFTLEAAVAVDGGTDRWTIVDALDRLVDKSLVTLEGSDLPRYRLLETIRLFANEGLRDSGESDAVAERHARHFVSVLDRAYVAWETMPDEDWVALYRLEIDNLRAALEWALAAPERRAIAQALGASGLRLFHELSSVAEGLRYFERLVPLIDQDTPPSLVAGLLGQAYFYFRDMPEPTVLAYLERAISLYRELDDRLKLGTALTHLGYFYIRQHRPDQAKPVLAEASELIGRSNLSKSRMALYQNIGLNALQTDQIAEGRKYFTQLLDLTRRLKSRYAARATVLLALLEYSAGDVDRAIEIGREAVREARAIPGVILGVALADLAAYLLARDSPGEARDLLEEAFAHFVAAGSHNPAELQIWAVLGGVEGRLAEAARLIGFVDAERVRTAQLLWKTEERLYGELSRRLEAGLPAAELASLREEGANWTKPEAVEFVRSRLLSPEPGDY